MPLTYGPHRGFLALPSPPLSPLPPILSLIVVRRQVVLELGTRFGGSTLFFSDVMRTVHHRTGLPYTILTVDIDRASIDAQVFEVRGRARARGGEGLS